MDRNRFTLFVVLSLLIFVAHYAVNRFLLPQPAPVAVAPADAKQDEDKKAADAKNPADPQPVMPPAADGKIAPPTVPGDAGPAAPPTVPGEGAPAPGDAAPPAAPSVAPLPIQPPRRATLGTLGPNGRLLVTLTNEGAGIERIELATHFDTEDRTGYLGNLATVPASGGGCEILAVGQGTPAQAAGVQVGDVIVGIDDVVTKRPDQLTTALSKTSADQKVTLKIRRASGEVSVPIVLARRPLEIIRPERVLEPTPERPFVEGPPSLLLTIEQIDGAVLGKDAVELPGLALRTTRWKLLSSGDENEEKLAALPGESATFMAVVPQSGLKIYKRYWFGPRAAGSPGYDLDFEIRLQNAGDAPRKVAYRLDGPNGLPTEGWWYAQKLNGMGIRDIVNAWNDDSGNLDGTPGTIGCAEITTKAAKGEVIHEWTKKPLRYLGVDAWHFAAALFPQEPKGESWYSNSRVIVVGAPDKVHPHLTNVSFQLDSSSQALAPGASLAHSLKLFVGPKDEATLAFYGMPSLVDYGMFSFVSQIMLWWLHHLYAFVGNYGVAIILLTVTVRALLLPLSYKQTMSATRMQALQPELARLREKLKDKKEEFARAQMDLFAKHKVNPFGGCLMALAQLPIFIGLYRGLQGDIALRDAALLGHAVPWCSNLAAPDMLLWLGTGVPMLTTYSGYLGPYLNVLPLVSIVLLLVQQKRMMPPPTDEQQEMQQKVMTFMMVFMGVFFYKVASGLCIYFIASSLWAMGERALLRLSGTAKPPVAPAAGTTSVALTKSAPAKTPAPKPENNGGSGGGSRNKPKGKK